MCLIEKGEKFQEECKIRTFIGFIVVFILCSSFKRHFSFIHKKGFQRDIHLLNQQIWFIIEKARFNPLLHFVYCLFMRTMS